MKIFEQFYAKAGNQEVELMVVLDDSMQSAQVKLKTANHEIVIPNCNVYGIFDSDNYDIDK